MTSSISAVGSIQRVADTKKRCQRNPREKTMSDLYNQLEELQGMARVLTSDVGRLRQRLGSRDIQVETSQDEEMTRRLYVRSIFALVEALVEQHKRLLLHLAESCIIKLSTGVFEALSERAYAVRENGVVVEREQYLSLQCKLRAVYRATGIGFGEALAVRFDNEGWKAFQEAITIRDRLTHPKTYQDCHVRGADLDTVDAAEDWYRRLNNEYIRVAREHRKAHHW